MQGAAWLHGWAGLLAAYTAVQVPLLAALVRTRAPSRKLLLSPLIALPLTAVCGATLAMGAGLISELGLAHSVVQFSAGLVVSATLGYTAGRALASRVSPSATYLRGAIVADNTSADHARAGGFPGSSRTRVRPACHLTLAGLAVRAEDESKHFKLIGTTGTGKSTAICELLQAALARGDRAVIADPDGGYLRRFYQPQRGDLILNPFDVRSARWDLFGELSNEYDIDQLARSLIPDHEGADRSWRGYARTFFSAVTAQTRAAGNVSLNELYRLLVVASTGELKTLVAGTPAQPFLEEHNGRMFDSIRSVTSSAVSALNYVARQRGEALSVRNWVQAGKVSPGSARGETAGVLFLPYRAAEVAALRSTISAWMRLAIFEAMNHEEREQRLWFVVDELDALGQIDGLKDALARLRKFGGRCVLGFQSIAQVSSTYGSGDAQTIVENCGNTLILRCSGSEYGGTSQFASRLIGEREVMRTTTSRSRRPTDLLSAITRSEHLSVEAAVMGSQIEQLPDFTGYLKLASSPEWRRVSLHPLARCPHQAQSTSPGNVVSFRRSNAVAVRPSARHQTTEGEHSAACDGLERE
jgi:hypothetical protein